MATFSVRFLGCKVSQADVTLIRDALIDAGHVESERGRAEVHVVNTCALTVGAEKKSRKEASRAARRGMTFVTGCAANLNPGQFSGEAMQVVPRSADRAAAEIVARLGTARGPACADDAPALAGRTRAFVKVQNGCDSACAFCIIPTTRGRAESRSRAAILRDARRRIAEGHPELVLTGINIGTYRDSESGGDLATLVSELAGMPGLGRLRISSIEPRNVDERLIAAIAGAPSVAPHLHVPLQTGDPRLLRAMGRAYSVSRYRAAAAMARDRVPGLNLTTDVIVGFPGEDDAAFASTIALVEEVGVSKVHVFPYSSRPGTAAAAMAGHLAPEVIRERAARLREVSDRLGAAHRAARVGSRDRVLIETADDGAVTGLTADYTRIVLAAGAGRPGEFVSVTITGGEGAHLIGAADGR